MKQMAMTVLIADSKTSGKRFKKLYPDLLKDALVFTMSDWRGLEGMRIGRIFVEHGCDRYCNEAFYYALRSLYAMSGSKEWHADPMPIILRED